MITLNEQTTVGEWVRDNPGRSRVFEKLKIDYCCGGKVALAEVCAKRGHDTAAIMEQLLQADRGDCALADADALSLGELIDDIIVSHHDYLREELPRLDFMTRKVAAVHGDGEPRLVDIRNVFVPFAEEMLSHMEKEERMLFPMIRELEAAKAAVPEFHCGSIANPINRMEQEHEEAGSALEQFRELSNDYTPPEWACNTFRALYSALAELESNMFQHVHKENNVLFPKALQRERALAG